MKTRVIVFLAVSAVTTLSFTVATSVKPKKEVKVEQAKKDVSTEPAGGFVAEDNI